MSDLFGEDRYFADAECFWVAQQAEIEARKKCYLAEGWREVVIVSEQEHFATWEHEHVAKKKGGRVYIDINRNGEVSFHEGYLTRKEARSRELAECGAAMIAKPVRPELTSALQDYVDLHRHAAVRLALAAQPGVALRVMVAHAICGSPLWRVKPQEQRSRSETVTASVAANPATWRSTSAAALFLRHSVPTRMHHGSSWTMNRVQALVPWSSTCLVCPTRRSWECWRWSWPRALLGVPT
ncbi:MAG: hypothetical protein IPO97_13295 [Sphingomonadales bacterium]|nr:hypothetical protein [Sphingomonadales bacterium]